MSDLEELASVLLEQYAPCLEVRAELLPICAREADREEPRTSAPDRKSVV